MSAPARSADRNLDLLPHEISRYYEARAPKIRQKGAEWRGPCPIHHGSGDSFAVDPKTGLWTCHSTCGRGGSVYDLEMELSGKNFKDAVREVHSIIGRPAAQPARIAKTYDYTDESGNLLFQAVRYEPKAFKQRRPDGRDGWIWDLKGVRFVLYRLSELTRRASEPMFLCEGEKDVETLEALGLLATTNPMGAGKWRVEYSEQIRGRSVVCLPDNDPPTDEHGRPHYKGQKHMGVVASNLLRVGCEVRIVEVPKGKDVADWLGAGGTLEELKALLSAQAPLTVDTLATWHARWEITSERTERVRVRGGSGEDGLKPDWPEPVPFLRRNTTTLPADLLPGFLGDMASATARATETPVELAALLGLAVVAASVAKKVVVCPEPGYIEPVNIYTAVGMESGNRKSAVLTRMTRPFVDWEYAECHRLKADIKRVASERKTLEARIESLRGKAARSPNPALMAQMAEIELSLPEVPKTPRLWTQDVTPERLGSLMAEQGERIALLSDEGGIFDVLAGRYSKGVPNLDLFLQAHTGTAVRVDRGSRPPVMLRNPALTVAISPQPDVLESLSDKPGFRGRGLLARFLYGLPTSPLGFRELKAIPIASVVEETYREGVERLLRLAPPMDDAGNWQPWQLRFSQQAYQAWKEFQCSIEILMREGGKLYYLKDWASKLPGAAARVAGVLHCVMADPTENRVISLDSTERSLNLVTPLIDHTLAVFNLMERDKNSEDAQKILGWIRKQGEPSFTVRDAFCAHQSRFKTMDGIRLPLSILEQHYYIRPRPKAKVPYRPSELYDVNPKVSEVSV